MTNNIAFFFWKWVAIGMIIVCVGPTLMSCAIHCYYKLRRKYGKAKPR